MVRKNFCCHIVSLEIALNKQLYRQSLLDWLCDDAKNAYRQAHPGVDGYLENVEVYISYDKEIGGQAVEVHGKFVEV